MVRYVVTATKSRGTKASSWIADDVWGVEQARTITVFEQSEDLVSTGLIAPDGREIKKRIREPAGFFGASET